MPVDNSTNEVIVSRSGTGWTVDVTACNLSTDLLLKDFKVFFDNVIQSNANFTKTSVTVITYTGGSIGTTTVKVRRSTPVTRIQEVQYADKLSSSLWENEFNRTHRILAEVQKFGGDDVTSFSVSDIAYNSVTWDGETLTAPSKNAVRDLVESRFPFATVRHLQLISDLTAAAKPDTGTKVIYYVHGYYSVNDGGSGLFYWDEADTTTTADNGLVFLVAGVSANGRWKRLLDGDWVSAAWWGLRIGAGVITHATANSDAIQAAVNSGYNVFIPRGSYTINRGIRCNAGYFVSIGKSATFGSGKIISGTGAGTSLFAWTGNTPVFDFTGSSSVTIEKLRIINSGGVAGTAEGSNNASGLGITMCRDTASPFVHYNIVRDLIIVLALNGTTTLGGVGNIAFFGNGCEHISMSNCYFDAKTPIVFSNRYNPDYFRLRTAFTTWNIKDYLPNFTSEISITTHLGRIEQCIFIGQTFTHPVMILEGITNFTFDNVYLSNRPGVGGDTLGSYPYLIFNSDANRCRFQGLAEAGGFITPNKFRRTGFMAILKSIHGWDVNFQMEYSYNTTGSGLTTNVGMLFLDWDSTNVTGIRNSRFNIPVRDSATDVTGNPVDKHPSINSGALAVNALVQNCEFTMNTSGQQADIIANLIRFKAVRCYEATLVGADSGGTSRHWEDNFIWAYGVVSNAGVKDTGRTHIRIGTTSLATTTFTVNFGQAMTSGLYVVNLTVEGATSSLVPILITKTTTAFTYQVYNNANTAVTTGFTNVHFSICIAGVDSNFN